MTVRKNKIVEYEGVDAGTIGDVLYWDGDNWVRLPPSDDGKRLVSHGTTSGPSWEWLIYNGAVVWYTPGGSWHIGPYIGLVWYETTTYTGTDPAQAALDVWISTEPAFDPVPSISYNATNKSFTVSGGGVSRANTIYYQKGTNDGVPTFGNLAWINGTPTVSSSSSSSSSIFDPGCCQQSIISPMPFPTGIPFPFCHIYSTQPPIVSPSMIYTTNGAGMSVPGASPTEGWVPIGGWNPSLPEIFFDSNLAVGPNPKWYIYDPVGVLAPPGPQPFQGFSNGINGCGGLDFGPNPGGPFITVDCGDSCPPLSSSSSSSSPEEPPFSSSSSSPFEEPMWWCVDVEPMGSQCLTGPIGPAVQRCMLGPIVSGSCCFDGVNWWRIIGINTGPYPTPDCLFDCEPLECIPEPSSSSSSSSSSEEPLEAQMYITDSQTNSNLYSINPSTGATTLIGPTGYDYVRGMSFDPTSGILYGVCGGFYSGGSHSGFLITINPNTGVGTFVGNTGIVDAASIMIDGTGQMYMTCGQVNGYNYYSVNKTNATVTNINTMPSKRGQGLCWQQSGQAWFSCDNAGATPYIAPFTNIAAGTLGTPISSGIFRDMTEHMNQVYGVKTFFGGTGQLTLINTSTGAETAIGGTISMLALAST